MRMLFKVVGLFIILIVCTALGFLKAFTLKNRIDSLCEIKNGLSKLKERLRLHGGDKKRLLTGCFSCPPDSLNNLTREDKTLWNEFLRDFGKGDTRQEYERCKAFMSLFDNVISQASAQFEGQQKLYKSLGFLSGVFICIFFI